MLMQCNAWCEMRFDGLTDPRAMAAGEADRRGSSDRENRREAKKLPGPVLTCVVSLSTWRAVTGPLLDENHGMWMNVFIISYCFKHQSSKGHFTHKAEGPWPRQWRALMGRKCGDCPSSLHTRRWRPKARLRSGRPLAVDKILCPVLCPLHCGGNLPRHQSNYPSGGWVHTGTGRSV